MPSERIAMRQVRDIMRLKSAGLAVREIGRWIGSSSQRQKAALIGRLPVNSRVGELHLLLGQ